MNGEDCSERINSNTLQVDKTNKVAPSPTFETVSLKEAGKDADEGEQCINEECSNSLGSSDESRGEKRGFDASGISKSQLKKLRKIQKWEATKGLKRKKEKEKKRAKRQALKDAGVVVQKKQKTYMSSKEASSVRVALDLSFNKLMTDKDQRKVVKQVLRSYSMNRQSSHPLQLYLTNFDESNKDLFGKFSAGYKTWDVHIVEENHVGKFSKEELVYLTSDSPNILTELDDTKVYVIGGIVDHNAHKGLCFGLAEKEGIGHARLPIDEYIKLEGRKVLPINHVFEILVHFAEFSNWEAAFYHVIPKRKGLTSHRSDGKHELAEEGTENAVSQKDQEQSETCATDEKAT